MRARVLAAALLLTIIPPALIGAEEGPTAIVLCYHIVQSPQDDRMEISRKTFRQHLQYLEMTGYNVISLRELYEYVSGKRPTIPENSVVITIDDGWSSAYTEAFPELKKRNYPFTLFIYPNIIGKTPIALTWQQIREMAEAGVDIQSHSLSHPFLTRRRQLSRDETEYNEWLHRELAESKRIIEKQTGRPVEFLAYPYGDYDARVARAAGAAGYAAALTCDYGAVKRGSNPLRMKRYVIDKKMTFADFRRYLGAGPMQVAEITPRSGDISEPVSTVSVRIPNHDTLDPTSVGLALLSLGQVAPFSYDAQTGSVTLTVSEPAELLRDREHQAVVWARDARSGKRVEAAWTFRFADPAPPAEQSPAVTARLGGGVVAGTAGTANEKR